MWTSLRDGVLALSSLSWLSAYSEAVDHRVTEPGVSNIAIIGAGAAGSSTAFHLRRFADEDGVPINITIFEKTPRIGGRTLTVNPFDDPSEPIELGASIFVEINTILHSAANEFGLALVDTGDIAGSLAIWDGESIRFRQDPGSRKWWGYVKLFWKYGMAPFKTQTLVQEVVGRFLQMYKEPHFPFESLSQKAMELELTNLTGMTGLQFLDASGIATSFAQDVIQASTRVNYATNLAHIHGLETMVSMAPEGAVQVTGGNWQIFENMVKNSSAAFCADTTVTAIEHQKHEGVDVADTKYTITTQKTGSSDDGEAYLTAFDKVVVAGPWQFSGIDAPEDLIQPVIDEIPYVQLHVTLFTSPLKVSPGFLNLAAGREVPTTILTTLHRDDEAVPGPGAAGTAGFFSVSTQRVVTNPSTSSKEYVYKVFSPMALDAAFLSRLLGVEIPETIVGEAVDGGPDPISWYYPHVFDSYPIEYPRVTFQDPILRDGLYYTSGIESFISTMETSALMGKNVAKLIVNKLVEQGFGAAAEEGRVEEVASEHGPGDEL